MDPKILRSELVCMLDVQREMQKTSHILYSVWMRVVREQFLVVQKIKGTILPPPHLTVEEGNVTLLSANGTQKSCGARTIRSLTCAPALCKQAFIFYGVASSLIDAASLTLIDWWLRCRDIVSVASVMDSTLCSYSFPRVHLEGMENQGVFGLGPRSVANRGLLRRQWWTRACLIDA
jgi:hypothetical protein